MSKFHLFWSLIFYLPLTAHAQQAQWDVEWYNSFQKTERPSESPIDPTSTRLEIPKSRFQTDLRINTKYTWNNGSRLVFRPRVLANYNQPSSINSDEKSNSEGEASLSEAFIEFAPTPTLTLAAGLQNYQWGPAELMSPTNPFFRFRPEQRAFNYREDGRFLIRANWSPNDSWSLIGLLEPINNGTSYWIYEQEFKPQGVLKIERRGANALNYIGFNVGTMVDQIPFIGEYFNYELVEGISAYLDARHSSGRVQYLPKISSDSPPDPLFDMVYVRQNQPWQTLLVSGLRWEGSIDVRLEYVYNSYGLTKEDMQAAFLSALPQHPRGMQNLKRLMGSGMELFGQHYGYLSLRIPDFIKQNYNLAFRYMKSLMDQSARLQTSFDSPLGESGTLFAEANISFGNSTQELSALEKAMGLLGVKWSF